jgi:hypothetical protein
LLQVAAEAVAGSFKAVWGELRAADCALLGGASGGSLVCGETRTLRLALSSARRALAATDAVTVTVTTPQGLVCAVPAKRQRGDGAGGGDRGGEGVEAAAEWALVCAEPGRHVVSATLRGEHVAGSPVALDAAPAAMCLAASVIRTAETMGTVGAAVAGRRVLLRIEPRDAAGVRMSRTLCLRPVLDLIVRSQSKTRIE